MSALCWRQRVPNQSKPLGHTLLDVLRIALGALVCFAAATLAAEEYGDPALWDVLAAANGDDRPRLLKPGRLIEIPPL